MMKFTEEDVRECERFFQIYEALSPITYHTDLKGLSEEQFYDLESENRIMIRRLARLAEALHIDSTVYRRLIRPDRKFFSYRYDADYREAADLTGRVLDALSVKMAQDASLSDNEEQRQALIGRGAKGYVQSIGNIPIARERKVE